MFCGITDKLASPHDYMWLRDELTANNNCIFYKEYDFGHLAFLMPGEKTLFHDMFALMKRYNTLYKAQNNNTTAEQQEAEANVVVNVANMTLTRNQEGRRINIIDGYLNMIQTQL